MSSKREVYWGNKWSYDFVRSPLCTGLDTYLPEEVLGDPRRLKYPWREDFQGERFAVKFPELAKPFIENAAPRQWTHFNGTPLRLGLCSGLANTGYSVSSSSFPDYSLPPPEEKHVAGTAANAEYTTLPLETRREPATNSSLVFSYLRRRNYGQSQTMATARNAPHARPTSAQNTATARTVLPGSRTDADQAGVVRSRPTLQTQTLPAIGSREDMGATPSTSTAHLRYRPAAPDAELARTRTTRLARSRTTRIPSSTTMTQTISDRTQTQSGRATEAQGAGLMSHKPTTNGVAAALRADNTRTSRIFF